MTDTEKEAPTLRPKQLEAAEKMLHFLKTNPTHGCYNASEMGCISGDMKVKINRGGNCKTWTLRELFLRSNTWDKNILTNTRSWKKNNIIGLNPVVKVIYQGKKQTIEINSESKSIRVTPDHEILTNKGWIQAGNLTSKDKIAVDRCKAQRSSKKKNKPRYQLLEVPLDYPQGHLITKNGITKRKREKHILMLEASLNGYNLFDYLYNFLHKHGKNYQVIDSKIYHVHHKDGDSKNNSLTNLELLTAEEHLKLHGKENYKNFNQGITWEKVSSIRKHKIEDVYDLVCLDPHRNFVANGIVVHNCGKTAMTIHCINQLKPFRVLIICPAVVKYNWLDELKIWNKLKGASCIIFDSSKGVEVGYGLPATFTILSYELARTKKVAEWLAKQTIDVLVLDEAHKVKNSKSLTKKSILDKIWPKATYKICLSGTPFTNSIEDCWTTFSRLAPYAFKNYFSFVKTFCYEERTNWGMKYYGLRNADKLYTLIRKHFYLRYTLEDMEKELPELIWTKITLPYDEYGVKPTEEEKKAHEVYIQLLEAAIGEGKALPIPPKALMTIRKEQSLKKLPMTCELVKNLVDTETPTIVFFIFLETLHKFVEYFKDYNPAVIYGEKSSKERHEAVKGFQNGATNLFISQLYAGGIGVNLQRAKSVVLAEMDYSPSVIGQAIGRAKRIGSSSQPINIYYPIVENTIEEEAARIVRAKARMFNKIVENK